jgi:hypothetical protein
VKSESVDVDLELLLRIEPCQVTCLSGYGRGDRLIWQTPTQDAVAGPLAIQVAWSDDPDVESFLVARNGLTLVDSVNATSVVDSSVAFNVEYCYQVFGYDFAGHLISATEEACIVA